MGYKGIDPRNFLQEILGFTRLQHGIQPGKSIGSNIFHLFYIICTFAY